MFSMKPNRCIDPVIKFCQECKWGWVSYPAWVETAEDLAGCPLDSGCMLGYDQGRPEDEPTEAELAEFNSFLDATASREEMRSIYEGPCCSQLAP